jgi:hypothetical protein
LGSFSERSDGPWSWGTRMRPREMEFRKLFSVSAKADISFISGFLRVTIEHGVKPARLAFDSAIFVWVVWGILHSWPKDAFLSKAIFILMTAGAVADLAYQLTGSEILEFSPEGPQGPKELFGLGVHPQLRNRQV